MPGTVPALRGGLIAWEGAFTTDELDAITRHGDALAHEKVGLSGQSADYDAIRITNVAWIERNAQTAAFLDRVEQIVLQLNSQFFKYDLFGLLPCQYAIYRGQEGGHFDWHKDYGRAADNPGQEPRKLSLSIQLSDGADYEGCDLLVRSGNQIDTAPRRRGTVIAFPAYTLHRVTPITAGTRKSLVAWAYGPEFR